MKTIKKILSIVVLPLALVMCNTAPRKPAEVKFTVDLSSPHQFPAGEIETHIDNMFPLSGIKKIGVEVSYFPYDDAVCLKYKSDLFTYHQFWSLSGREAFLQALENYNVDYSERNIVENNRTTKRVYGAVEGYLYWQMFSITRRVSANMEVNLGYAFSARAPYFTVTQKLTTYEDIFSEENNMNSQEITMYFTRAQARELAELFDQEYLRSLIPPELGGLRRVIATDVEVDEY